LQFFTFTKMGEKRKQVTQEVERMLCGICKKEILDSDDKIMCEAWCQQWFHMLCSDFDEKLIETAKTKLFKKKCVFYCQKDKKQVEKLIIKSNKNGK